MSGLPSGFVMPRWGWYALAILAAVAAFYIVLDAYGDAKYQAGKDKADLEWKEANDRHIQEVAAAGTVASKKEAKRLESHSQAVELQKEKIDAAVAEGTSPLDTLFNSVGS